MVGSAVQSRLEEAGYSRVVTRTREELDLTDQAATNAFFRSTRPEYVVLAAARVGGILANDRYRATFIRDNLEIQTNVIHAAHRVGARRLVFLGSSCAYPKHADQPMREAYLLSGPLEPTNRPYAVAKIAGIEMCRAYAAQHGDDFWSLMPANLYGPGDSFDLEESHVLPALIRKFHGALGEESASDEPVTVWGSGTPRREFLYCEDLADAVVHVLTASQSRLEEHVPDRLLNVGTGTDVSIERLAHLVRDTVGSNSPIEWDRSKPDGTPRKLLDVSRLEALGWSASTSLRNGLERTYRWYLENEVAPETAV